MVRSRGRACAAAVAPAVVQGERCQHPHETRHSIRVYGSGGGVHSSNLGTEGATASSTPRGLPQGIPSPCRDRSPTPPFSPPLHHSPLHSNLSTSLSQTTRLALTAPAIDPGSDNLPTGLGHLVVGLRRQSPGLRGRADVQTEAQENGPAHSCADTNHRTQQSFRGNVMTEARSDQAQHGRRGGGCGVGGGG